MKKKSTPPGAFLLFAGIVVIASCSKGAEGPAGPTGATGPKGDSGTANVYYSNWSDITFYTASSSQTTTVYSSAIAAPRLTTAILDSGSVMVYFNIGSTTSMNVVHLNFYDADLYNIYSKLTPGKIYLYSVNEDLTTTVYLGQKYYQYRYVIIPSGVHVRSAVNWNDYNQVKAWLGLKD